MLPWLLWFLIGFTTALGAAAQTSKSAEQAVAPGWNQSFKAGATDSNGHYMGAGTIMHLVRHQGVHLDKVTGVDHLFLTIGTLGIFSGVYDESAPGKVKWSPDSECGSVETRPLAIVEAIFCGRKTKDTCAIATERFGHAHFKAAGRRMVELRLLTRDLAARSRRRHEC